jgi:hypothetical protein
MGRKNLPDLPDTGRHYVEHTIRARLASPGIERYGPTKASRGTRVTLAVLGLLALVAAVLWLTRG